jgi:hypothetical protein
MTVSVNICRPGYGASCSLCCGSHNYQVGRVEIEALFVRRARIMKAYSRDFLVRKMIAYRSCMTGSYYIDPSDRLFNPAVPALYQDCPRCPFVGFVSKDRLAGCLLVREDDPSDLRHECFLSYRGKIFTCPARESLHDKEILYAARLARDWYYYGILIHEPELLRRLMEEHPDAGEVPALRREALERELEKRVSANRELHAIHSYFY